MTFAYCDPTSKEILMFTVSALTEEARDGRTEVDISDTHAAISDRTHWQLNEAGDDLEETVGDTDQDKVLTQAKWDALTDSQKIDTLRDWLVDKQTE